MNDGIEILVDPDDCLGISVLALPLSLDLASDMPRVPNSMNDGIEILVDPDDCLGISVLALPLPFTDLADLPF
jgi:hypothetical protein